MKSEWKKTLVAIGFMVALTLLAAAPAMARNILRSGQMIYQGEALKSPNGRFKLVLQNDGNLVLYDRGRALWSSGTNGKNARKLVMQSDGNLVLYGPNGPVWATNTSGNRGAYLMLQDDGNLVIYKAVWSTHTIR